jgi:hypothetical protein
MNSVQHMLARHLRALRVSRIPCTVVVVDRPSCWLQLLPPPPARSTAVLSFSTTGHDTTTTATNRCSLDEYKRQLLQAALDNVIPHGWTNEAIALATATVAAASNSNNNPSSISMATAGLITVHDVLVYAMEQWNAQLRRDLEQQQQSIEFLPTGLWSSVCSGPCGND